MKRIEFDFTFTLKAFGFSWLVGKGNKEVITNFQTLATRTMNYREFIFTLPFTIVRVQKEI